ncbi:MAG TPA: arginine--tRNA ligase [Anaerolineales bacterium]|nr:arginine--tRNA ligase [Anaerolineae bacterium]HIQ02503.1 arginine--tRNA ligase [Anaerolineales bacterium]
MHRTLRSQIADLIRRALEAAQAAGDLPPFPVPDPPVERSRQPDHGDYSSSVCLKLAREARTTPLEIARRAIAHLDPLPFIGRVEPAAPGYINLWLDEGWLTAHVEAILTAGETFGRVDLGRGRRVQVEFVSANPTGPLTLGSARNAVLGDALASVLEAAGHEVEREYYVNDAGSQVRVFGESVFARYAQALGEEAPFPEDGYRGGYVTELGRQLAAETGRRYLEMDRREAVRTVAAWAMYRMVETIRQDLADLGVHFDTWRHERSLYEEGIFDRVLAMLREKGYIVEYDDAVWFRHPDLEKDAVLIRSPQVIPEPSERPTYLASDAAYLWDKLVERGFDRAIYVWGADHHGDVPRVKAAAKALGLDPDRVVLILYQLITLWRSGEEVRMSKRTGEFVTLRELLDEVGPDPIRFMLLSRTADAPVDFDLDLAVEQSDRNPVYYVQYAHARIASILRHAQNQGWGLDEPADLSLLHHPSEMALIRKMLELPEVIEQAATRLSPHFLPFYAQELAATFHAFYRDCRVVSSDPADAGLTRARLRLVQAAKLVLARVLHLMGMTAPERM